MVRRHVSQPDVAELYDEIFHLYGRVRYRYDYMHYCAFNLSKHALTGHCCLHSVDFGRADSLRNPKTDRQPPQTVADLSRPWLSGISQFYQRSRAFRLVISVGPYGGNVCGGNCADDNIQGKRYSRTRSCIFSRTVENIFMYALSHRRARRNCDRLGMRRRGLLPWQAC